MPGIKSQIIRVVVSCTNEGDGLLVEHSTGQQMKVVLHRVHDHRVTRVVAALHKTHTFSSIRQFSATLGSNNKGRPLYNTTACSWAEGQPAPPPAAGTVHFYGKLPCRKKAVCFVVFFSVDSST